MSLIASHRISESLPNGSDRGPAHVRESYLAIAGSVPVARRAISDFAAGLGVGEQQLAAIRLASSEALTNVVRHAYRSRTGHFHVTASVAGDELWVLISDSGCGIHAGLEGDGLGLGLALIAKATDGFSVVAHSTGGTELRMRFSLGADRL